MLTLLGKENQTFILYHEHQNLPFFPGKEKKDLLHIESTLMKDLFF